MTKRRKDEKIEAVVNSVIRGKHGPYAVAKDSSAQFSGDIRFGLEETVRGERVWQESMYPQPGAIVVLSRLVEKRKGWRAHRARFRRVSNQHKRK